MGSDGAPAVDSEVANDAPELMPETPSAGGQADELAAVADEPEAAGAEGGMETEQSPPDEPEPAEGHDEPDDEPEEPEETEPDDEPETQRPAAYEPATQSARAYTVLEDQEPAHVDVFGNAKSEPAAEAPATDMEQRLTSLRTMIVILFVMMMACTSLFYFILKGSIEELAKRVTTLESKVLQAGPTSGDE